MDVTRKNFVEVLPLVKKCIDEADFFAIDGEFTGLSANRNSDSDNCYDTLQERYGKTQRGSANFLLIQFGLSAFRYDKVKDEYEANTFNFYLFPVPFSRQAPDHKFLCQASSIDFLVSQGFNFNKTFHEGISYLSYQEEVKMRTKLHQRHDQMKVTSPAFTSPLGFSNVPPIKSPAMIPEDQKTFVNATLEGIRNFLNSSKEPHLNLPPCSAFQRKLIYQSAGLEFGSKMFLETVTLNNRERYIKVSHTGSEADLKHKELERQVSEIHEIDNAVGFSQVIKILSKSGKLIVGHNMFLDLIHLVHQFHVPLPEHLDQFKSVLNCLFPQVCDTKLMSSMHPFKEQVTLTVLGDLNKYLSVKPFKSIKLAENSSDTSYKMDDENLHEAGYDALITGLCFIRMANYLGTFQTPIQTHIPPNSALLKPFINKIFIMRIADIPYMDIDGTDLNPTRDNVFHVEIHENKTWTYTDVRHHFAATGVLSVGWIDDTTFLVGIPHDNVEAIASMKPSGACTVTPYNSYRALSRKSRKRCFENMNRLDVKMPVVTTNLNVNAKPFVSRENSPVPEDFLTEDVGEVCSKRARIDHHQNQDDKNDSITSRPSIEQTYASVARKSDSISDVKIFQVPDEW